MDEVETLAYAGQLPWHGLGTYLGHEWSHVTGSTMLVKAGLDWETYKESVCDPHGNIIPGWYSVRRTTSDNVLGVVGEQFTCIQNSEIFGVPDSLVEEGRITYEVAGALREGAIVFALARLSDYEITRLGGHTDPVERFMLWTAGHGNGRAVIGGFTDVRVVCKNTLDAAMGDSHGINIKNRFRIKHTKSGPERIQLAHQILLKLDENGRKQQDLFQDLAQTPMSYKQAGEFYTDWLSAEYGTLAEEALEFEKRMAKREEIIRELQNNFGDSPGNTGETAWDTYNGLGYWLDHQRSRVRNATTRMDSILLGGQVYGQKGRAVKQLQAWTRSGKLVKVRS